MTTIVLDGSLSEKLENDSDLIGETGSSDGMTDTEIDEVFSTCGEGKIKLGQCKYQFETIDKHIKRLPQFRHNKELLKCLSESTDHIRDTSSLMEFKRDIDDVNNTNRFEMVIENQRGATLFGSKLYTQQQLLYPIDPPKYQTLNGNKLSSLGMYPEPNSNWSWAWNNWHILMINDVDEEGWIYSKLRFNSKHWSSVGHFGKFVRRRIWVRMLQENSEFILDNDSDSEIECLNVLEITHEVSKHDWNSRRFNMHDTMKVRDSPTEQQEQLEISHKTKNMELQDHEADTNVIEGTECEKLPAIQVSYNDSNEFNEASSDNNAENTNTYHKHLATWHNQHIKNLFFEISTYKDDDDIIDVLLQFFKHIEMKIILILIEDYELCENKHNSWINKLLQRIRLPESKRRFLNKFQLEVIDEADSKGDGESLKQLYTILDTVVSDPNK